MVGGIHSYGSRRARLAMVFMVAAHFCACGGGGGGGGGNGFYAGTWSYAGVKVLDSCRSSLPATAQTTHLVNQDGTKVVVNSGSLTFSGGVHDEDGFEVNFQEFDARKCDSASRIRYTEASDGRATAAWIFVVRCGSLVCSVGYGGEAIRSTTKSALPHSEENQGIDADEIIQSLEGQVASGEGSLSSLEDALNEAEEAVRTGSGEAE